MLIQCNCKFDAFEIDDCGFLCSEASLDICTKTWATSITLAQCECMLREELKCMEEEYGKDIPASDS